MKPLLMLLCSLVLVVSVRAQEKPQYIFTEAKTGNGFLRRCAMLSDGSAKTQVAKGDVYFCSGYLDGLLEGFAVMNSLEEPGQRLFCIPTDRKTGEWLAENGQLIRILFKYINDHPEIAHYSTSTLFARALRQAFPCHNR